VVHEAVPEAIEGVRTGWRLIGYDVPVGRRTGYFTFVVPEPVHVHLGFAYGAWMADPDELLQGAHLNLRKVRFVTYEPGDAIPTSHCQTRSACPARDHESMTGRTEQCNQRSARG
jgi:hypothetical protein